MKFFLLTKIIKDFNKCGMRTNDKMLGKQFDANFAQIANVTCDRKKGTAALRFTHINVVF